jgi:hypothetical protein
MGSPRYFSPFGQADRSLPTFEQARLSAFDNLLANWRERKSGSD